MGFAVPMGFKGHRNENGNIFPWLFRLTPLGKKLLGQFGDHPLSAGFLDRLRQRCPELPDHVVELLEDARSCVEHGLLRPAAVLLGVAYESVIQLVGEALGDAGKIDLVKFVGAKAAARIALLEPAAGLARAKEDRFRFLHALNFANALRERRNDGSHAIPRWPFEDLEELQELIMSASRHLPALWEMRGLGSV